MTTLLANDKIHPRLAFEHCGLFVDPDLAYTQSKVYAEERKEEVQQELAAFAQVETQKSKTNIENEENAPVNEDDQ